MGWGLHKEWNERSTKMSNRIAVVAIFLGAWVAGDDKYEQWTARELSVRLDLLKDEAILSHLEVSSSQTEALNQSRRVRAGYSTEITRARRADDANPNLTSDQRLAHARILYREFMEKCNDSIDVILNDKQLRRIDHIVLQHTWLGDYEQAYDKVVDLSVDQRVKMNERAEELADELRLTMERHRRKCERELETILTADQRKKWHEARGPIHDFAPDDGGGLSILSALR